MMSSIHFSRSSAQLITILEPNEVFVFGSNTAGAHWGGAARLAHSKFGAVWGQGVGLFGQSYGIPTLQADGKKVSLDEIKDSVHSFISFARARMDLKFLVTELGCGIAGFKVEDIAPLFADAISVSNIYLPHRFWIWLDQNGYLINY